MYVYVPYVAWCPRRQKRASDPQKMVLNTIVNYYWDSEKQTWVLCKQLVLLNCWAISPA